MREDLSILESVISKNRAAIVDLHQLDTTKSRERGGESTEPTFKIPRDEDVLPPSYNTARDSDLTRRFSKRGVRLGVHMSILDMGAHNAPESLKKKWLHHADTDRRTSRKSRTSLSRISKGEPATEDVGSDEAREMQPQQVPSPNVLQRRNSRLMSTPMGRSLSKAINKLSTTNIGEAVKVDENMKPEDHKKDETAQLKDERQSPSKTKKVIWKIMGMHTPGDLTTPDFNKEFENGRT